MKELYQTVGKNLQLRELFAADQQRFQRYSLEVSTPDGPLLFDYSKNLINEEILKELFSLCRECRIEDQRTKMSHGELINFTEKRAVLHTALRAPKDGKEVKVDGKNVFPDVHRVLKQMKTFSESIRSGQWKGYTGKAMTDIVNIGIGGSDLGPLMVTEALKVATDPFLVTSLFIVFSRMPKPVLVFILFPISMEHIELKQYRIYHRKQRYSLLHRKHSPLKRRSRMRNRPRNGF